MAYPQELDAPLVALPANHEIDDPGLTDAVNALAGRLNARGTQIEAAMAKLGADSDVAGDDSVEGRLKALEAAGNDLEMNPYTIGPLSPGNSLSVTASITHSIARAIGGLGSVHLVNTTKGTSVDLVCGGPARKFAIDEGDGVVVTTPALTSGPTSVRGD